jgi:hypothetical protein
MSTEELRRQHFAIRSFTESVDEEWPMAPSASSVPSAAAAESARGQEGGGEENEEEEEFQRREGGEGGMKASSTADTIIEVAAANIGICTGRQGGGGGGGDMATTTPSPSPTTMPMPMPKPKKPMDPTKGETQKYTMRVPGPEVCALQKCQL